MGRNNDILALAEQESADRFYWQNGPCCAGCDHWAYFLSVIGECRKAAPISGEDRAAMIGMTSVSCPLSAGHPLTRINHLCGDFKDDFDWSSLPLAYRKAVGVRTRPNTPETGLEREGE